MANADKHHGDGDLQLGWEQRDGTAPSPALPHAWTAKPKIQGLSSVILDVRASSLLTPQEEAIQVLLGTHSRRR